jgi:hypothetical protein
VVEITPWKLSDLNAAAYGCHDFDVCWVATYTGQSFRKDVLIDLLLDRGESRVCVTVQVLNSLRFRHVPGEVPGRGYGEGECAAGLEKTEYRHATVGSV